MPLERLAKLEAQNEQQTQMVREIHQTVCGKPGSAGLTERMARVEQRQALQNKISWAGFLAIISLAAAWAKSKL